MGRIAIIGAGAAGCFAAANIGKEHEVTVFEKSSKPMQKVKVSGGGRCNLTHACFDIPELVKRYPRGQSLLKRSLYQFGPRQTIEWFESRGVAVKEEADGRMFPTSDNSQSIIDCIWDQMMASGVQVRYNRSLINLLPEGDGFRLQFSEGADAIADKVILAPGSILKPEQWKWLSATGHTVQAPAPSLFTFNLPGNAITRLMGVSVPVVSVRLAGTKFKEEGPILITHWGLSGPAVLKTSAYAAKALQDCQYEATILVNWLQDMTAHELLEQFQELRQNQGKASIWTRNPFELPRRLWEFLLERIGIPEQQRWAELSATMQQRLIQSLVADAYSMKGKTTYKEEFVTCGGISLPDINPQTMESRKLPGLYVAGEAMDVDGITGGYNFQHAWSSAWIAAQSIKQALSGHS